MSFAPKTHDLRAIQPLLDFLLQLVLWVKEECDIKITCHMENDIKIENMKGTLLNQMCILRHSLKMPLDILVNLTRTQAMSLLKKLKKSSKEGLLTDVPNINILAGSSPAKNSLAVGKVQASSSMTKKTRSK